MYLFQLPYVTVFYEFYETPGAAPGAAAPPAPGSTEGEPTTPPSQPAPGQGQGQGDGFRQQYFRDVPDEVWGQVEPHIQRVNQHVTQLEQRFAPFRGWSDDQIRGMAGFVSALDRDPVGQWIQLASAFQQQGILDPDLDLEHLAALAKGEDPDTAPLGNGAPGVGQGEEPPPWAQQFMSRVDRLEQGFNQYQQTTRERVEDAALQRQLGWMQEQLKSGGYPEDALTREALLASFIAHRGNAQQAVESALNQRSAILKGFTGTTEERKPGDKDLDLPQGSPKPRNRPGGRSRGMFPAEVTAAAEQALRATDK